MANATTSSTAVANLRHLYAQMIGGQVRDTPGGTQYVVRRSGFAKPTTLHHSCHVEIIKYTP